MGDFIALDKKCYLKQHCHIYIRLYKIDYLQVISLSFLKRGILNVEIPVCHLYKFQIRGEKTQKQQRHLRKAVNKQLYIYIYQLRRIAIFRPILRLNRLHFKQYSILIQNMRKINNFLTLPVRQNSCRIYILRSLFLSVHALQTNRALKSLYLTSV